jgi:hypothetical protein
MHPKKKLLPFLVLDALFPEHAENVMNIAGNIVKHVLNVH